MSAAFDLPQSAAVLGAGRSGRAAARALVDVGADVVLVDDRTEALAEAPAETMGSGDPGAVLRGREVLVKSPGIGDDHPVVRTALGEGIPVWSEVELGYRLLGPGVRLIGVTGTNGKTTTSELVGAMLEAAYVPTVVAGNVGLALCEVAPDLAEGSTVVCELSSFQLEHIVALRCDGAALLNITPDHLDRHGTFAAYRAAKLRIFERQTPGDVAVLNEDDPECAALRHVPGDGRVVRVHARDAEVVGFDVGHLRGDHNRVNVAVAAALARAAGVDEASIVAAVRDFRPVPHRLEDCGVVAGVRFWNDSKATNVDATLKALTAFPDGDVRLVLGGSDKGADFAPLANALRGRVRRVYLTGPAGERLVSPLVEAGVDHVLCAGFDDAVNRAADEADAGDHVLLAPACASFDEFADYTARGDRFRALVAARGGG